MKETDYYVPIRDYLEEALKAVFAKENTVAVGFDATTGVHRMSEAINRISRRVKEEGVMEQGLSGLLNHAIFLRELTVDLTGVALLRDHPERYRLIIGEVKARRTLGLKDLSQLLGYLFSSWANYGLLIGVDSFPSQSLDEVLRYNPTLLEGVHGCEGHTRWRHQVAVSRWDSAGKRLIFHERSKMQSIDMLARIIENDLSGN